MSRTVLKKATEIVVGVGVLTWSKMERITDRYGMVRLMPDGETSATKSYGSVPLSKQPRQGAHGTLIAKIVESRESTHIGDLFHGIRPRKTPKGTRVVLGTGKVVRSKCEEGFQYIGVNPGTSTQWMNIRALYDCHEHVVELIFVPGESPEKSFSE